MILKTKFSCGTVADIDITFTSLSHEQTCQHLVQYSNGGAYCLPDARTFTEILKPTVSMQIVPEAKPTDAAFDASVTKNAELLTKLDDSTTRVPND